MTTYVVIKTAIASWPEKGSYVLAAENSYYRGFAANTQRTRRFVNSTDALKIKSLDKTTGADFNLAKIATWFCIEFGIGLTRVLSLNSLRQREELASQTSQNKHEKNWRITLL